MFLDDDDLYLLREGAAGRTQFAPEGETEEALVAFDRWGDLLLALRDRGLLDFSDGMVMRNHRTKRGKYAKIVVRGLTEAGRRELARHELPDEKVIGAVRQKIVHEFATRERSEAKKRNRFRSEATMAGASGGSRVIVGLHSMIEEEYGERAARVLALWRQVIQGRGLVLTAPTADLIREEARQALVTRCGDLEHTLDELAAMRPSTPYATVGEVRQRALDRLSADLDFERVAPGAPAVQPTTAGDQFTIYGNVGALQTGAGSQATVTMHLGPQERADVLSELRELRRVVEEASLAPEQAGPLIETVNLALVEAEKPTPNAVTLRSLAMGLAVTVQTIGAIPGALEVARRLAALLGFHF